MKTDSQLRDHIIAELQWTPEVDANEIGVIVKDGVVTLTGHLSSYAQKQAAEHAVHRVSGVRALAIELTVRLPNLSERTDAEIALTAERAIEWNPSVPSGTVHPTVEHGWVTLDGQVEWNFQRVAAEQAVRTLFGVVGVVNRVTVVPKVAIANVESAIHDALARQAEREARLIDVSIRGTEVTLRGRVGSWAERNAVFNAAWSAPGVSNVVNNITLT